MRIYDSEADFSNALNRKLQCHIPFIQRFETGLTGTGVPDIYVRSRRTELWLELKNRKTRWNTQKTNSVDWRKGQQTWAMNYYKTTLQGVLTLVACPNGFVVIPMFSLFPNNKVEGNNLSLSYHTDINDLIQCILARL
jgi:hypothetical protein